MTAGFYKQDKDELLYAPNFVEGNGYVLVSQEKDHYNYPVFGWRWFENDESAKAFFLNYSNLLTQRQFRLGLLEAGIDPDSITTMLAGNKAALIEWNFASYIDREHPLIGQLGLIFGLTSQRLDEIFENAKKL